ncbi:hypothetical protein [Halorussus sp. AFM4]|uniref:hypothetical protein n=1 Tax=Halorussus sp. AFM4 TaxID=3421651 RepID=UPI003EBD38A1
MSKQLEESNQLPLGFDKRKPISKTIHFRILFGLSMYISALWSAYTAESFPLPLANAPNKGVVGISWVGSIIVFVLLSLTILLSIYIERNRNTSWFERGYPFLRLRALIVFLLFVLISRLVVRGEYTEQFGFFTVLNGAFLVITFEVYSQPLLPRLIDKQQIRSHKNDWWRFTQLFVTGSTAILVGIGLQFFLGNYNKIIAICRIGLVPFLSIVSVLLFVGWKYRALNEKEWELVRQDKSISTSEESVGHESIKEAHEESDNNDGHDGVVQGRVD